MSRSLRRAQAELFTGRVLVLSAELDDFGAFQGSYCAGLNNVVMVFFTMKLCVFAEPEYIPPQ